MQSLRNSQQGTSLIEVLVAVVVLALGLIGVAGLQATAIGNNQLAGQYTNAATLAQNLAERMRSNREGVVANLYNLAPGAAAAPPKNCADAAATCNSEELAKWDLAVWYASTSSKITLANVSEGPRMELPSAKLGVSCAGACTEDSARLITVYWDADRNGATGTNCNASSSDDLRCFTLPFIP